MKRMILASGSPRRKELLQMLEVPFEVLVSDTKEVITKNEPAEVTKELSYQKAMAVAEQVEEGIIIGADTVVSIDGKILGKPADTEEAREMIYKLQDKYEGRYKYHEIQNEKNNSTYGSSSIGSIYIWKCISNGSRKYRSNGGSGRRSGNGG